MMRRTVRQLIGDLEKALAEENQRKHPARLDFRVSLVESDKIFDNTDVSHDFIRDALERELDLIQVRYERTLGKEAARETFARRASALRDGALDPGMASHEVTKPKPEPQLSAADLAEFEAHAAANPWNKKVCSPSQHIEEKFEKWLWRGLRRAHIAALPETTLGNAYAQEVFRYPDRRVKGLIEGPQRLPADAPRPISMRRVAELSEAEQREQRRVNVDKKRRSRQKHAKPAGI